jgi:hypothetical protein
VDSTQQFQCYISCILLNLAFKSIKLEFQCFHKKHTYFLMLFYSLFKSIIACRNMKLTLYWYNCSKTVNTAVPWLRSSAAGLSSQTPGSIHVGSVVDKVALGQVFLRVLWLSRVNISSTVTLQTHIIWGLDWVLDPAQIKGEKTVNTKC